MSGVNDGLLRRVIAQVDEAAKASEAQQKDEPALRYDAGKPRFDLIPSDALEELVRVYSWGATKYAEDNWAKGMSWRRCFGSLMRHSWAWLRGEDVSTRSLGCTTWRTWPGTHSRSSPMRSVRSEPMTGSRAETSALTERQKIVLARCSKATSFASCFWLSHETGLTVRQVNAVLHQLLAKGLVEDQRASRSGRAYWWRLTVEGRTKFCSLTVVKNAATT